MDFLKQWTYNISLTLLISSVLSLLTPKGNIGRFFKISISIFIMISFILPFANLNSLSFPSFDQDYLVTSEYNIYENMVDKKVYECLANNGYSESYVYSNLNFSGDEIYINRVVVTIPDNYPKEEVKDCIYENIGLLAEVYYPNE